MCTRADLKPAQVFTSIARPRDAARAGVGALARIAVDFFLSSLSYWRLWAPQPAHEVRRVSVDMRARARGGGSRRAIAGRAGGRREGAGSNSGALGLFINGNGFVSVRESRKAPCVGVREWWGAATPRSRALWRTHPRAFSPTRTRDPRGAHLRQLVTRRLSPWVFCLFHRFSGFLSNYFLTPEQQPLDFFCHLKCERYTGVTLEFF